jgi:ABC-type nitrate/sulfonate/bicarbonate transport system substrate-binding protein
MVAVDWLASGRASGRPSRRGLSRLARSAVLCVFTPLVVALGLGCSGPAPASAPTAKPAAATAAPAAAPTSAAAAAPTSAPAAAREPATVRITDIQITSAAGSYIAAAKGYFQEEGIQPEFVLMASGD